MYIKCTIDRSIVRYIDRYVGVFTQTLNMCKVKTQGQFLSGD